MASKGLERDPRNCWNKVLPVINNYGTGDHCRLHFVLHSRLSDLDLIPDELLNEDKPSLQNCSYQHSGGDTAGSRCNDTIFQASTKH
ncbi:Serine/threonine-protein phosphatase 2Aregulatory subunit A alpha isoform [Dirofilaria immitis]